jgi:putative ABC transport system permease protein
MSSSIATELRHAARGLLRAPTVTVAAVLCLGLGIGATTAISSAIDRALLQPLPFREPGQLVTVYRTTPHFNTGPFSAPNYTDLSRSTRRIASLAALTYDGALLTLPSEASQVSIVRATGNVFSTLGVQAQHGRLATPADDAPGQPRTAMLSDEIWRERFAADRSIVGRPISLDGEPYTVIGILPPRFTVPHGNNQVRGQIWVPMRFTQNEMGQRRSNFIMLMGRLAPGASAELAQTELVQLFEGLVQTYPQLRGESIRVLPLASEAVSAVRTPLLLLLGAVFVVLLIAATNVASLLLARGVQRQREVAIRAALGGGRWAIVRPVLVESYVIVGAGLALGLLLAWVGVRTIGALAVQRVPQLVGMGMDLRVVGFAILISVLVALVCGAAPALRGTHVDPQDALRGGRGAGAGREHHRALGALVVAEIGLSLMLLVAAGLVLKGFSRLLRNDPGFDPQPILTLEATVSAARYPDGSAAQRFLEPALDAIRQMPGVRSAGAISLVPYVNWGWNFNIRYEGQPGNDPTRLPIVENRVITPGFFEVTGQRLLAGRYLRQSDDERPDAPAVVVVNRALVERDFPVQDPIGKRFHTGDSSFATIVGVVENIRNVGPVLDPRPEVYRPWRQASRGSSAFPIMVRVARGDPLAIAPSVRQAIRSIDAGAAVTSVKPMTEVIAFSVGRPRFYLALLGVFAAIAVVLAVSGIYGVMSYAVAQRTREIGIRAALGSTPGRTIQLIARQGTVLIAVGVLVGLAGAYGVTRLLVSLLYGISPLDGVTWFAAVALLSAAGMAATLIPARRATKVNPVAAIRAAE